MSSRDSTDNNSNNGKNATHLEALLGTWTVWTDLSIPVAASSSGSSNSHYRIQAYMVVHLVADPSQHWSCHKAGCSELHNHICQWQSSQSSSAAAEEDVLLDDNAAAAAISNSDVWTTSCRPMTDTVSTWSDTVAFVQAGFSFQAPFSASHNNVNNWTSGADWSGPYHVVWAHEQATQSQQSPAQSQSPPDNGNDAAAATLDRYYSRYVTTAASPLLAKRPRDESLWGRDEFAASLGPAALRTTVARQATWNWTHNGADPFRRYQNTCASGNLTPTLPLYRVEFDPASPDHLRLQVAASLLLAPSRKSKAFALMPWIHKVINAHVNGFALRGPYCWQNDPKRGWLIDVPMDEWMWLNGTNSDAFSSSSDLHMTRGCVQGLPCVPPMLLQSRTREAGQPTTVIVHDRRSSTTGIIPVGCLLFVGVLLGVMLARCWQRGAPWMLCRLCRVNRRRRHTAADEWLPQQPLLLVEVEEALAEDDGSRVAHVPEDTWVNETLLDEVEHHPPIEEREEHGPAPISNASTTASV